MRQRTACEDLAAGRCAAICHSAPAAAVGRGEEVVVTVVDAGALHVELGDAAVQ